MYCSKCGNKVNENDKFCTKCGNACMETPPSPQQNTNNSSSNTSNAQNEYNNIYNNIHNNYQNENKPSSNNPIALAGIICSIVGLLVFGVFLGIIAIVLGIVAYQQPNIDTKNKQTATFSIVIGIVDIIGALLVTGTLFL